MAGNNTVGLGSLLPSVYGVLGISSARNAPGGRFPGQVWKDGAGNVWLFGGYGADGASSASPWGYLNDLWELNPSTHVWTWMAGSSQASVLAHRRRNGDAGSVWDARYSRRGKHTGREGRHRGLDRCEWESMALRRQWIRCDRRGRPSERRLEVPTRRARFGCNEGVSQRPCPGAREEEDTSHWRRSVIVSADFLRDYFSLLPPTGPPRRGGLRL